MYTDWFKLSRLPFRLRPDPDFLYLCGATSGVFDALCEAAATGHGTISLCAGEGVGKTTLLHAIAHKFAETRTVARVQQGAFTGAELLESLREQFGIAPSESATPEERVAELTRFIAAQRRNGRPVVILVDEAHQLSLATLRELLNLVRSYPDPLLVLAGEPELTKQLESLSNSDAAPPLLASLHLPHLAIAETEDYIKHRLAVAGNVAQSLFESETITEIQRYTGGTPQLINIICDNAMVAAAARNNPRVGLSEIRDALRELKWVEFAAIPSVSSVASDAVSGPIHARREAELYVQQGAMSVKRVMLKPGRLIVGRAKDAGLQLDSEFVSREHCQFVTAAGQSFVEDLGSTNGVIVNGRLCQLHRLSAHDKIVIGDHLLTYEEPTADK